MAVLDVEVNRHLYIGGSDIAAVMGLSRYKTPLKLWAEKTGKVEAPDLSGVEAVEMGKELEQFVADMFTKRTGKIVRKAPKAYTHRDYPFMVAHIDRLVTGTDEILECKTCNAFKKDEWEEDEIPQEYILQVIWYLGITGKKIGHIACLIGGQKFVYKQIEFDAELFDKMVETAKIFWQHVQDDIPVAVMSNDDETLADMYGTPSDFIIEMFPEDEKSADAVIVFEENVRYLQELKMHISEMDKEKKEIENKIKDVIKNNLGIRTPKYLITWKAQTSHRFDDKKFKEENPDLFNEYIKENTFRVMRIKSNKEDK